jgi:hypothetical protein
MRLAIFARFRFARSWRSGPSQEAFRLQIWPSEHSFSWCAELMPEEIKDTHNVFITVKVIAFARNAVYTFIGRLFGGWRSPHEPV